MDIPQISNTSQMQPLSWMTTSSARYHPLVFLLVKNKNAQSGSQMMDIFRMYRHIFCAPSIKNPDANHQEGDINATTFCAFGTKFC